MNRSPMRAAALFLFFPLALGGTACGGGDGVGTGLTGGLTTGGLNATTGLGAGDGGADGGGGGSQGGASGAATSTTTAGTTSATTGSGDGGGCAAVSEKADLQLQPTDVIWAIDTSGSMVASFPAIQQALVDFSNRVTSAGIDAHIVLLAGSDGLCVPTPLGSGACGGALPGGVAADSVQPALLHLNLGFGYAEGMSTILNNHAEYAHVLRPEARTHLVLTEDGPPPMGPDAVEDHLEGVASATGAPAWNPPLASGEYVFHGVVCVDGTGTGTCLLSFVPPTTTLELIDRTGGLSANLDNAGNGSGINPFSDLLDALAERVVVGAELSCEFPVPSPPAGETLDPNAVNVVLFDDLGGEMLLPKASDASACGSATAWTYDDAADPSQVVLCPAACEAARAQASARIDIQFGCATVPLI